MIAPEHFYLTTICQHINYQEKPVKNALRIMKDKFDLVSLEDARLEMVEKLNNKDYFNKDFSLKVLKRIEELMIEVSAIYLIENGKTHPDLDKIRYWRKPLDKDTKTIGIHEREFDFKKDVRKENSKKVMLPDSEVENFIRYWTEKNKSETKMKWEMQQTFQINRRLLTWKKNSNNDIVKKGVDKFVAKFKLLDTGYYRAYCSSCGNAEYPSYEWQLKNGSSCCAVEYLAERSKP